MLFIERPVGYFRLINSVEFTLVTALREKLPSWCHLVSIDAGTLLFQAMMMPLRYAEYVSALFFTGHSILNSKFSICSQIIIIIIISTIFIQDSLFSKDITAITKGPVFDDSLLYSRFSITHRAQQIS